MVFGFFAVVGKRQVAPQPRQLDSHRGRQWNALVGRAKNHVELQAGSFFFMQQLARIKLGQPAQLGTVIKQARVEEIRAHAARFGFELPKFEYTGLNGKLHKFQRQRACRSCVIFMFFLLPHHRS